MSMTMLPLKSGKHWWQRVCLRSCSASITWYIFWLIDFVRLKFFANKEGKNQIKSQIKIDFCHLSESLAHTPSHGAIAMSTTTTTTTTTTTHTKPPVLKLHEASASEPHYSAGGDTYRVAMAMHAEHRAALLAALRERASPEALADAAVLLRGGAASTRNDTDHEELFRQVHNNMTQSRFPFLPLRALLCCCCMLCVSCF